MGSAARAPALKRETAEHFIERTFAQADRARTSIGWGALVALSIAALWQLQERPAAGPLHAVLVCWGLVWVANVVAVRWPAPTSVIVGLEVAEQLLGAWSVVVAVYATHTLVTPVWLLAFARAFAWVPRRRAATLASRAGILTAHLGLMAMLALEGRWSGATIVFAFLVGKILVLEVSTQLITQRLELEAEAVALHAELENVEVRRENDRIARELHDGLGAELVALLLVLRAKGASVGAHTQRILNLLEELRSAVWSLRGGRGSLSEFEKLVRARARMTLSKTNIVTSCEVRHQAKVVEPDAAMAMLGAVHTLLKRAVALPEVPQLQIDLEAEPHLTATLHFPGHAAEAIAALAEAPAGDDDADGRSVVTAGPDATLRIALT